MTNVLSAPRLLLPRSGYQQAQLLRPGIGPVDYIHNLPFEDDGDAIGESQDLIQVLRNEQRSQVVFGITSLAFTPRLAKDLLNWTRKHWSIESKLHYRRDVTLREDATRMRQPHQSQVVATLNNFVIALMNYLGFSNLASARRFFYTKFDALIFSSA